MKTEGYDVSKWEVYHGFAEPKKTTSSGILLGILALLAVSFVIRMNFLNKFRKT